MEVLVLAAAAGVSAFAAWLADRKRSRRRNRSGECAACATPWAKTPSGDPYLIQGRLICEACAKKAKRRIPWQLAAIGGFAAVASGSAMAGHGVTAIAFISAGSTVAMTVGAVQLMKLANRSAQRRIATGDFPDIETLRSNQDADHDLIKGPLA